MELSSCRYLVLILNIVDPACSTQDVHWVKCRFDRVFAVPVDPTKSGLGSRTYEFVSVSAASYIQLHAALRKSRAAFNVVSAEFHCVDSVPYVTGSASVVVDLGLPYIDFDGAMRVRFTERGAV